MQTVDEVELLADDHVPAEQIMHALLDDALITEDHVPEPHPTQTLIDDATLVDDHVPAVQA